jgi:hypothetical protein
MTGGRIPLKGPDSARSPITLSLEIRLARFRRGAYPDPVVPCNGRVARVRSFSLNHLKFVKRTLIIYNFDSDSKTPDHQTEEEK